MNIYQKLIEIRKSVKGFEKDAKGYNYTYISGEQVLSKVAGKMNELQIVLEPRVMYETATHEIFQYDTLDKYGKTKHNIDYIVKCKMEYVWINAENPEEKIVIPWALFGQQEEISKAFGSGLTYSERYFLLKYFGMQTDEDDPDSRQGEKPEENGKKGKGKKNDSPEVTYIDNLTQKAIEKLMQDNSKTIDDAKRYIKQKYGQDITSLSQLTPQMAAQLQLKMSASTETH